jgi:hypothetical protein
MPLLQRLSAGLAASLRLGGRPFAAGQQGAAFHLSAALDARRRESGGDGSSSSDSEDEVEARPRLNPKRPPPREALQDEPEFPPRFDPSALRGAGAPAACRQPPPPPQGRCSLLLLLPCTCFQCQP